MQYRGRTGKSYFRPYLWLITLVSLLVPRRLRADWKREWRAELEHRESRLRQWQRLGARAKLELLGQSLGSLYDALWFQKHRLEDEMIQDLRYGMRMLFRSPVFTAVAVLSLALGIGANTAIFSLVNAVLLENLPVRNPEQLVLLRWIASGRNIPPDSVSGFLDLNFGQPFSTSFSYPAFEDFRERNEVFSDVFAFSELGRLNVSIDGQAESAEGQIVSGDYYSGLGVQPVLGRTLAADDDRPVGAEPVAVISHAYWQRRFGGDPAAVGKVIYVNSSPFTIVGVTPPKFHGTLDLGVSPDITVPTGAQTLVMRGDSILTDRGNWWVQIIGRLKPGVTAEQAQAHLDAMFQQEVAELIKSSKEEKDPARVEVLPGGKGLTQTRGQLAGPLYIMVAVAVLVLAIACANIANLLLARSAMRQKEIAMRLALGASRLRLIRQLLTESALLAVIGGGLGLLLVYCTKDLLTGLLPGRSAALRLDVEPDVRVLAFTAAVSLLTGLLFGLAPAIRATKLDLAPDLKDNARTANRSKTRLGKILLVSQVAISLLLLIGAGLFVRTLRNLENIELGFNRENLLIFKVDPTLNGYEGARAANLYEQMKERIEALPGVKAVGMSRHPLISGGAMISMVEGREHIFLQRVSPNFFETMEIPLLIGRNFTAGDNDNSSKVVIVNEAYARRFLSGENPIGRRVKLSRSPTSPELEVVGMVKDAMYSDLRIQFPPTVYLPYLQGLKGLREMTFEVRTINDPSEMMASVRRAVQEVDSNVPLFNMKTQEEQVNQALTEERLFARLSTLSGSLALTLACIGLYGLMSYSVARRTHEIGIRMALGAQPGAVRWLVMRETLLVIFLGVVLGLAAGLAAMQVISSMLFGLTATDPVTLLIAILILIAVTALAGYLPARRASRVDPMIALRYE
ncbi:MAG TPA: ABC transporter permease [Blastocatellia bacterium]|nr:ABC transporter permease [Blastocatellia bacterium]